MGYKVRKWRVQDAIDRARDAYDNGDFERALDLLSAARGLAEADRSEPLLTEINNLNRLAAIAQFERDELVG